MPAATGLIFADFENGARPMRLGKFKKSSGNHGDLRSRPMKIL
jgi:hypothetical protein